MMSGSRRWSGVAAVVLAGSLAACGGASSKATNTPPVTPRQAVLDSVNLTAAAKSARVALNVSTGGQDGGGLTANGVTDLASGDSQFTVKLSGAFGGLGGAFGGGLELREVDKTAYIQLPTSLGALGGALGLPAGVSWLSVPAKGGAGDGSFAGLGGETDPSQFLTYLEGVSDSVTQVGSESVRGVETTHYHAVLDLGKAIERPGVAPALRDKLKRLLQSMGPSASAMPADVWIDAQGMLRRVELRLDFSSFIGGTTPPGVDPAAAGTVDVALDLYDFGVPVFVSAPPASQVEPLSQLAHLGAGLGGGAGIGAGAPGESS